MQSYSFGYWGPHAKSQNRSFTPSGLYMKIGSTDSGGYVKFTPKYIIVGGEGGVKRQEGMMGKMGQMQVEQQINTNVSIKCHFQTSEKLQVTTSPTAWSQPSPPRRTCSPQSHRTWTLHPHQARQYNQCLARHLSTSVMTSSAPVLTTPMHLLGSKPTSFQGRPTVPKLNCCLHLLEDKFISHLPSLTPPYSPSLPKPKLRKQITERKVDCGHETPTRGPTFGNIESRAFQESIVFKEKAAGNKSEEFTKLCSEH